MPAAVLGVAAATRLIGLDQPGVLVFDETYYVKDAASLLELGYEGRWPEGANELFAAGTPPTVGSDAAFVAHPPLGKWVIALGMLAAGPGSPYGWRLGVAVSGILLVAALMLLAHLLWRSTTLTVLAGGLLAIDGNAIVMSRVALLDGVLALAVVLAVIAVVLDRRSSRARLARWLAQRRAAGRSTDWGPAMLARPWLLAAGVLFGLAASVKWSALYLFAAFAVLTVVVDALDRRRAGVALWASGTLLRQAPLSVLLTIPAAAVAHLVTWWGWFATSGGYGRSRAIAEAERWPGILGAAPDALQNWWAYQQSVYGYHVGESSPHPYEAPAAGWPLLLRPTYMHYLDRGDGTAEALTGIPNPLLWWGSVAAVLVILVGCGIAAWRRRSAQWRVARTDQSAPGTTEVGATDSAVVAPLPFVGSPWSIAVILTGVADGYLPWMLYPERTTFFFYTIVITPFLVLALVSVLGAVLGRPSDTPERRRLGAALVVTIVTVLVLLSAFFLPLWTATPIPLEFLRLHYWLPSWI
jgi:dolichyl-phosphate-mannose--protein O-mannosyl transferase